MAYQDGPQEDDGGGNVFLGVLLILFLLWLYLR